MKAQPISCDTSAIQECKRVVGGRLRHALQVTMAVVDDSNNKSSDTKYIEYVKQPNHKVNKEDPIRTIMFLGSWSHT
ncbi:hypothetical protein HanPSC8_Chr10g0411101 [Helianthus annuus]|nr:hypothetical protein HanPSC8_Chr10g0411101 [Helianthus annuus]